VSSALEILYAGLLTAAVLFLVTAGLQLVFGVQRVVNLSACSLYALGAYFGSSVVERFLTSGGSHWLVLPVLLLAGLVISLVGMPIERVLRLVYRREASFQLLLTFAFVLIFQDVFRFFWGSEPKVLSDVLTAYGRVAFGNFSVPTYGLMIIVISALTAVGLWVLIERTTVGHIVRATAENRQMADGMGVDTSRVNFYVFMLASLLGTVGGALAAPTVAASLDMAITLIVEAFAVIVIGGLGSMRGALLGAVIVGLSRSLTLSFAPEFEVVSIYIAVVAVLLFRPYGLLGKPIA
jgi:branched-chain amino acid transport system permease protein